MAAPQKPAAPKAAKGARKGRWSLYEKKDGKLERKNKSCPKCGHGTFMAKHANRWACGACKYTEFVVKS